MFDPECPAQSQSKLLGHRPGQHSRQVLMQEVLEETDHPEWLDQPGLDLDRETYDALTSLALAQRRPVIYQVEVLLRQTLGLAFPTLRLCLTRNPARQPAKGLMSEGPQDVGSGYLRLRFHQPDPLAILAALRVVSGFPKQPPKCTSDDLPKRIV